MMACANDHAACDPDVCFTAKLRYMRKHGGLQISYPYGQAQFHDAPSVQARERQALADARSAGLTPERV